MLTGNKRLSLRATRPEPTKGCLGSTGGRRVDIIASSRAELFGRSKRDAPESAMSSARLDPVQLQNCFVSWTQAIAAAPIDGKTARRLRWGWEQGRHTPAPGLRPILINSTTASLSSRSSRSRRLAPPRHVKWRKRKTPHHGLHRGNGHN